MDAEYYWYRWQFVEPRVSGRVVLDVGPAELTGTVNSHKLGWALWPRINNCAAKAIGLEKNMEQVAALREMGYDIRYGDAENFNLGMKFDTVFGGELIEHLSNPGLFLECAKQHMSPDGQLVLTTPNRFDAVTFFSAYRRNRIPTYDLPIAKHVAFYGEHSIRDLLERHGFSSISIGYYVWVGPPSKNWRVRLAMQYLVKFRRRFLPGLLISARVALLALLVIIQGTVWGGHHGSCCALYACLGSI